MEEEEERIRKGKEEGRINYSSIHYLTYLCYLTKISILPFFISSNFNSYHKFNLTLINFSKLYLG